MGILPGPLQDPCESEELVRSHPTIANSSILVPREMQPPGCDTVIFKLPLVLGIRLLSSSVFKIKASKVIPKSVAHLIDENLE